MCAILGPRDIKNMLFDPPFPPFPTVPCEVDLQIPSLARVYAKKELFGSGDGSGNESCPEARESENKSSTPFRYCYDYNFLNVLEGLACSRKMNAGKKKALLLLFCSWWYTT